MKAKVKKRKRLPPWRPEAGSEDNIFGQDPRAPSGRVRRKQKMQAAKAAKRRVRR